MVIIDLKDYNYSLEKHFIFCWMNILIATIALLKILNEYKENVAEIEEKIADEEYDELLY